MHVQRHNRLCKLQMFCLSPSLLIWQYFVMLGICKCCRLYVKRMLQQRETYTCQMTTVSDIMKKQGLSGISLLKIDVERAELDVLQGIDEAHWPKIAQLVMEVHDVDNRLQKVMALLSQTAGFTSVVTTQDEQLKGSTLFNIYCHRKQNLSKQDVSTTYTQQSNVQNFVQLDSIRTKG